MQVQSSEVRRVSDASQDRSVYSVVCAVTASEAASGSAAALRAKDLLRGRFTEVLRANRSTADRVGFFEDTGVACFHNSTAAIDFAAMLAELDGSGDDGPCRISVHMGAIDIVGITDAQLGERPVVRVSSRLARRARPGQVLATQLFFNIVAQFDHRCKELLIPVDSRGAESGSQVYQLRHKAGESDGVRRKSEREDGAFLPEDPAKRKALMLATEAILAQEIGPMARIVVERAVQNVPTKVAFFQRVSASIDDPKRRDALMKRLQSEL